MRIFISVAPYLLLSAAFALPVGFQVEQNSAEIVSFEDNQISIRADDRSILNWPDFSIGEKESVHFLLPDSSSWVLNRVNMGGPPSQIHGCLSSNGQVLLINPNGVIIGKEGSIQMQSFIASTLDLQNDFFLSREQWVFDGASDAKIHVAGTISVQKDLLFGGAVSLLGKTIFIDEGARVDASGPLGLGTIDIGGKNTRYSSEQVVVASSALLSANALESGDGGSIVIWSDYRTVFAGKAEAKGGSVLGNGGFIEVSGGWVDFRGTVDTRAPFGTTGQFLLDPLDIEIVPGAVDTNVNVLPGPIYVPTASPSSVSQTTINAALGTSNVTIQSLGVAGPDQGNVFIVNDYPILPVPLTTNTLTLRAFNDILINASLAYLGPNSGSLILLAPTGDIVVGNAATPTPQTTNAIVRTDGGLLQLTAQNVYVQGNPAGPFFAQVNSFRNGTTLVSATLGDVQVLAGNGDGAFAQIGADSLPGTFSDINVTAAQNVIVTGAPFSNSYAIIGHGQAPAIKPDIFTGNISVTAGANVLLTGGLSPTQNGFAVIGHQGGDATFSVSCIGDVTVRANGVTSLVGGSNDSFARIGHGSIFYNNAIISGSVDVFSRGPITLTGGTNSSMAHIGHFSLGIGSVGSTTINSTLIRVNTDASINMSPGINGSTAIIGTRTNSGGAATGSTVTNLVISALGNLTINPSIDSAGVIGIIAGNMNYTNGPIQMDVGGDIIINNIGGVVGDAIINYPFTGGVSNPTASIAINARNLFLTTNAVAAAIAASGPLIMRITQDIQLTGIAPSGTILVSALNGLDIAAGRDIIISSQTTSPQGRVGIGGGALMPMNLSGTVRAGRDIVLLDTSGAAANFSSYIASTGSGILDVIAGRNMIISNRCLAAALDQLNLVVDDNFPAAPLIGPGSFQLLAGGTVRVNALNNLRIFTARQNQNIILGTLISSGTPTTFTPGPIYANLPPELWGVYFFDPFFYLGEVFTIFYKDSLQQAAQQATVIVDQLLVNFHPYNEFPGWRASFVIQGDEINETYLIRRRQLNFFNQPKSWTPLLPE